MMTLALAAAAGCLALDGDRILARDMARAWPEFTVAEETALGYAPVPGARRIYSVAELARLAARFGLAAAPSQAVCFERRMTALTREQALKAMHTALAVPEARIEILELSRYPVPEGELAFPRAGLRTPGRGTPDNTPLLWKGTVTYGNSRRFAVWARVAVRAPIRLVRAAVPLRAGEIVRLEQLRVEEGEGFPFAEWEAVSPGQVAGRRPRRTIPAGSAIPLALLDEPRDVERGDSVQVTVAGAARLELTGRAESAGAAGETVVVRNPESRRTFSARVAGKGAVEVDPGGRER
ncbi:MAG TPA: flagellar basal body P-ring formation chaperone FlgA [Bryobacteraceae bacterium]|nr:flagellar basal body P-ring formation chaperone FlgA [Bryobacteraceae bacterium]